MDPETSDKGMIENDLICQSKPSHKDGRCSGSRHCWLQKPGGQVTKTWWGNRQVTPKLQCSNPVGCFGVSAFISTLVDSCKSLQTISTLYCTCLIPAEAHYHRWQQHLEVNTVSSVEAWSEAECHVESPLRQIKNTMPLRGCPNFNFSEKDSGAGLGASTASAIPSRNTAAFGVDLSEWNQSEC